MCTDVQKKQPKYLILPQLKTFLKYLCFDSRSQVITEVGHLLEFLSLAFCQASLGSSLLLDLTGGDSLALKLGRERKGLRRAG